MGRQAARRLKLMDRWTLCASIAFLMLHKHKHLHI